MNIWIWFKNNNGWNNLAEVRRSNTDTVREHACNTERNGLVARAGAFYHTVNVGLIYLEYFPRFVWNALLEQVQKQSKLIRLSGAN